MRIYLAGSITGLSYDDVVDYFLFTKQELESYGYEVFHPMTGKGYLRNEVEFKAVGYDSHSPVSTNHGIVERDRWMVQTADILLVNLTNGDRVSIGSMFELAWAHHMGKHSIVIMPDTGVHQHCFVLEAADIILPTMDQALEYLHKLINGKM
jgi:nucleoside 2-deoxyribosyltransferase